MPRFVIAFAALLGLVFGVANVARAEFKVEISGVGITQIPIGISDFKGADSAPQRITQIIAADLDRSGQFKLILKKIIKILLSNNITIYFFF